MTSLKNAIGIAALTALTALAPTASAAPVVPPGNSAATQYTETFPTSGGEVKVSGEIQGGGREPAQVLGTKKADKLESKGPDGVAVADLAAETAPVPTPPPSEPEPPKKAESDKGEEGGKQEKQQGGGGAPAGSGNSGGGNSAGGADKAPAPAAETKVQTPSGSSATGELASQATGLGSGNLGIFLPLLLIATVIAALAYLWRQRHPVVQ